MLLDLDRVRPATLDRRESSAATQLPDCPHRRTRAGGRLRLRPLVLEDVRAPPDQLQLAPPWPGSSCPAANGIKCVKPSSVIESRLWPAFPRLYSAMRSVPWRRSPRRRAGSTQFSARSLLPASGRATHSDHSRVSGIELVHAGRPSRLRSGAPRRSSAPPSRRDRRRRQVPRPPRWRR